jgi:hypothetical protein
MSYQFTPIPQQRNQADFSSYRAILNLIKQGHNLDIQYFDVSHGPSHAHGMYSIDSRLYEYKADRN